jgi:hypothetical protein
MDSKPRIQFHYLKSGQFRIIHSDGAWGGIMPDGNLLIGFYNQRPPIPDLTVQEINANGTLGPEIPEAGIGKRGIVREIEAGIVLSAESVDNLMQWLIEKREQLRKFDEEKQKIKESLKNASTIGDHAPRA